MGVGEGISSQLAQESEKRAEITKALFGGGRPKLVFSSGAGKDAPEADADLTRRLAVPARVAHDRGLLGRDSTTFQRHAEYIWRRLGRLDIVAVNDQEAFGPFAEDLEVGFDLIRVGRAGQHRSNLKPLEPFEKLVDARHGSDLPEPSLVADAVQFARGITMAPVPVLASDRLDEKVPALSDLASQGLLVDGQAEFREGLLPGGDVLRGVIDQRAVDVEQEHLWPHPWNHRIDPMAKKPAPKKSKSPASSTKPKHENPIQRVAEELESRFLEGAEMATETTSPETNAALAAWAAIEGPHDTPAPKAKAAHAKRKSPRSKAR